MKIISKNDEAVNAAQTRDEGRAKAQQLRGAGGAVPVLSPRPLDKARELWYATGNPMEKEVGQERRLLYGLDGLYDGSDGGDCGDGNGKDGAHHRVHENDEGATLAHQFAANPHEMPRTQKK